MKLIPDINWRYRIYSRIMRLFETWIKTFCGWKLHARQMTETKHWLVIYTNIVCILCMVWPPDIGQKFWSPKVAWYVSIYGILLFRWTKDSKYKKCYTCVCVCVCVCVCAGSFGCLKRDAIFFFFFSDLYLRPKLQNGSNCTYILILKLWI